MKRFKQLFVSLLTCCLAFGIFPTTVRAAENNWAKAYSEFIEEDTEDDLKLRDHAEYQLIYIDNDDIPELWVDYYYGYAGGKICTFDGKEVRSIPLDGDGKFEYLEGEGRFYISGGGMDDFWDSVYTLHNGSFEETARGTCEVLSWDEPSVSLYRWEGVQVSENEYQQNLSSAFDSSGATKINLYDTCNYVDILMKLNPITSISLDKHTMTLVVGAQDTLKLTTEIGGSVVVFKSSNPSVAAVDESCGIITAVSPGTAVITAIEEGWGNTASCIVTVTAESNDSTLFADVLSTTYYYDAVYWAVEQKITFGTSTTTFSPDATCNRAQILSFLWRANGSPEPTIRNPFKDIKDSDYFYKAALWAAEKGMVSGSIFNSDIPCTRASTMEYMWKNAGKPNTTVKTNFIDVPTDADYTQAVAWAMKNGVTVGTSATTFSPDTICTRGQIVTFLYRAMAK